MQEYSLMELVRLVYKTKWYFITFVFVFVITGVVVAFVLDEKYELKCLIKPAEASKETTILENISSFARMSLSGQEASPVYEDLLSILTSEEFLTVVYQKYKNEALLFDEMLTSIDFEDLDKTKKEEKKLENGLKFLKDEIKLEDNNSKSLTISIKLKDKYFAYRFLNDFLIMLKDFAYKKNVQMINSDIAYYRQFISTVNDPAVTKELEYMISQKIKKSAYLTSNTFSVIDKPRIPFKKIYPNKRLIVVLSFICGLFGYLILIGTVNMYKKLKLQRQ